MRDARPSSVGLGRFAQEGLRSVVRRPASQSADSVVCAAGRESVQQSKPNKPRVAWIEWVRACGACAIVLLHVLVSVGNAADFGIGRQIVITVPGIVLCRWAVPGFFMISGLLLLDPQKQVTWAHVRRYVLRMVGVLATFGLLFALMEEVVIARDEGLSIGLGILPVIVPRAVVDVLTGHSWDHLWYVYTLIGIYLLLPAVRWLQDRWGTRGLWTLVAMLFVGALVIPTLFILDAPNLLVGLACFCMGGCLRQLRLSPLVIALGVGSLVVMLVVSISGLLQGDGDRNFIFLQGSCFAFLYAIFVLCAARHTIGVRTLIDAQSVVGRLAQDSLGIYIIHPLFVHIVLMVVDPNATPPVVFEVLCFVGVLGVSILSTRLLRRVPGIGALL